MLKPNSTILFQGDSVTDVGCHLPDGFEGLGNGYPKKIKEYIDTFCGDRKLTVINRGISGNRVKDLQGRWEEDCINLKPDYLSILIGINDTWRRYDQNDPTTCEDYERVYRDILTRAVKQCGCKLILLEPFIIQTDEQKLTWYEDLAPKVQAVRRLSREFNATYIPLDGIFAACSISSPPSHWSEDGVHPTDAGHALIAKRWLDAVL